MTTHVMDCECYIVKKKWYLREVSVFDLKTNELYLYQIYYFANEVSYNKSMAYQINVVHGLPLIRGKVTNDFFRCSDVLFFKIVTPWSRIRVGQLNIKP